MSVGGDLLDPGDRADDHVELAGEVVELLVGQRQPGQPGEVGDLVAGDGTRHPRARCSLPNAIESGRLPAETLTARGASRSRQAVAGVPGRPA